jgi:hypothetical protein
MRRALFLLPLFIASHAMAYDPTKADRYPSPDMYRPNVDSVIVRGNSSSGDISNMSVVPSSSAPAGTLANTIFGLSNAVTGLAPLNNPQFTGVVNAPSLNLSGTGSTGDLSSTSVLFNGISRTLLDTISERPSVVFYGVDMTGVADSTAAFTAALNSGKHVTAPCGTIRLVGRVDITTPADFSGAGPCTLIKNDAPAGSAADRVINVMPSAVGTRLDNFALTQQTSIKNFIPTTACGGTIICGAAILVQADDTLITKATISDSYDNCLAFGQLDSNQTTYVPGKPRGVGYEHIRTSGCGFSPRREAAGIDVGTASNAHGNDHIDVGSSAAWILDVGAGANGNFSNHTAINTPCAPADGGSNGRSQSFYVGGSDALLTNFTTVTPCDRGWFIDAPVHNLVINNYLVKAPGKEAMFVRASSSVLSNGIIDSPGFGSTSGTFAGVYIDTSAGAITGLYFNGLGFHNANGTQASQGLFYLGSGSLDGAATVTDTTGVASIAAVPSTFKVIQPRNYPN